MSSQAAEPETLQQMQERGGQWAAYENHDLGSPSVGHLKFLAVGEGRTFETPPESYPDPSVSQGHVYRYIGMVDMQTGEVVNDG